MPLRALALPLFLIAGSLAGQTLQVTGAVKQPLSLAELLKRAGVPQGEALQHGGALAGYLVAEGSDGYRIVDSGILVADTIDGKPIAGKLGPLRLVAPKDKTSSRSVRMLTKLEVVLLRK